MDGSDQTLQRRLEVRGWRMTAQRRAIASTLHGDNVHLTADDVFAQARTLLPDISLATVYNCLTELVALGEIGQVVTGRGPTRYDPNVVTPHHHALCDGCGEIRDVPLQRLTTHCSSLFDGDFRVTDVQVLFRGQCDACHSTTPTSEP